MNTKKAFASLLIVVGTLSLAYGGFDYTEQTHQADVGPIHLSVDQDKHISTPVWMGAGILILGIYLLAFGTNK